MVVDLLLGGNLVVVGVCAFGGMRRWWRRSLPPELGLAESRSCEVMAGEVDAVILPFVRRRSPDLTAAMAQHPAWQGRVPTG